MSDRTQIEYRICWAANSNISFRGATDWQSWDLDDEGTHWTSDEIIDDLHKTEEDGNPSLAQGLELALESSGFEWWVETREVDEADE